MALLGYAGVSTDEQDPAHQLGGLEAAGVEQVWTGHAGCRRDARQELPVMSVWRVRRDTRVVIDRCAGVGA